MPRGGQKSCPGGGDRSWSGKFFAPPWPIVVLKTTRIQYLPGIQRKLKKPVQIQGLGDIFLMFGCYWFTRYLIHLLFTFFTTTKVTIESDIIFVCDQYDRISFYYIVSTEFFHEFCSSSSYMIETLRTSPHSATTHHSVCQMWIFWYATFSRRGEL